MVRLARRVGFCVCGAFFVTSGLLGVVAAGCNTDSTDLDTSVDTRRVDGSEPIAQDGGMSVAPVVTRRLFDSARIGSKSQDTNFQKISAPVTFDGGPFRKATLVIDLSSTCYPFESRAQPPLGQNWPADCDAFDRIFDVNIDEPNQVTAPPAIQAVHAITPFGGPLHLETDITDIANGLSGEHVMTARIDTWSDRDGKVTGSNGGWTLSARVDLTPGVAPHRVLKIVPIINTSVSDSEALKGLPFETPEGTTSARIEIRTSGHGGGEFADDPDCIGPAEEFCERKHTFTVDDVPVGEKTAWRKDCATFCTTAKATVGTTTFSYCKENPCGAVQSVKAPRANWCPGSETPPFVWADGTLTKPGPHKLSWAISKIAAGGSWRAAATFIALGD